MVGKVNGGMMEDVAIIGGLIMVQLVYAGNAVLMNSLMSVGLTSLTIVTFISFSSFLVLLPFSFYYERSRWPKKFNLKLFIQIFLISFGGTTLFQTLLLKGMHLTSPTMATAMPNIAPGLIFIIAWICRLEKVNLSCSYSRVKIMGTLLCVSGALTMSIMQSISTPITTKKGTLQLSTPSFLMFDRDKIIGCLYLLVAVLLLSSIIVLQAFTLADFPAPMSLSAITSFLGAFISAAAQLVEDGEFKTGWPLITTRDMIGCTFLAGAVSGICLSFCGWAIEKRGPVLVSMFSPIATVSSVIFSVVTIGNTINIGSFAGMFLMFTGLYFVLWAKGKEGYKESECDAEKPLLS